MPTRSKRIGNEGERNHRKILARCWPEIKAFENRYHMTRDHDNTEGWYVQSKKRKSWNIKDVVKAMEQYTPGDRPWLIAYEDSNRKLTENPSTVVGIMPLELTALLIHYARLGGWDGGYE